MVSGPEMAVMYQQDVGRTIARIATVAAMLLVPFTWVPVRAAGPAAAATPPADETGVWIDHKGQGAIEIAPCGAKLCGHVVWLKSPADAKGRPLADGLNPDPAKRKQPICGLKIIGELQRQRDGTLDKGWVYSPEKGESYDLAATLKDAGHLAITGYQGMKLFSETYVWTRAPAGQPLPRCAS
jgi:uncharacterized protein (DUF2147 family)